MPVLSLDAPPARFYFHWRSGRLRAVGWYPPERGIASPWPTELSGPMNAIRDYFTRPTRLERVPLALEGSAFQLRVWEALRAIPPGETRTYGELAVLLGSGARAVGNACRRNPCPIVVPCHRVLARNGIGGYAGARGGELLAIKRWLLRHEGVGI